MAFLNKGVEFVVRDEREDADREAGGQADRESAVARECRPFEDRGRHLPGRGIQSLALPAGELVDEQIAAGVETKYSYSPGHTIKVNGHSEEGILQALLVSVGLRVYLTDFGR